MARIESIVDLSTSSLSSFDKVLFFSIIFSFMEFPFKFLGRYLQSSVEQVPLKARQEEELLAWP